MNQVERNALFEGGVDDAVCFRPADGVQAIADQVHDATLGANTRQIVKCSDCFCGRVKDGSVLVRCCYKLERRARGVEIFCEWSYERSGLGETKNRDAGPFAESREDRKSTRLNSSH